MLKSWHCILCLLNWLHFTFHETSKLILQRDSSIQTWWDFSEWSFKLEPYFFPAISLLTHPLPKHCAPNHPYTTLVSHTKYRGLIFFPLSLYFPLLPVFIISVRSSDRRCCKSFLYRLSLPSMLAFAPLTHIHTWNNITIPKTINETPRPHHHTDVANTDIYANEHRSAQITNKWPSFYF